MPEKIIGIYVLPYNYNNNNLIISGIFTHNIKYKEINFSFRRQLSINIFFVKIYHNIIKPITENNVQKAMC